MSSEIYKRLCLLIMFFFSLCSTTKMSRADDVLNTQDFLQKYALGLKAQEERYESIYVNGTVDQELVYPVRFSRTSHRSEYSLRYYKSGGRIKLIRTYLSDNQNSPLSELVYVDEPHRLFIAERTDGARGYRLNHLGGRKGDSLKRLNFYVNKFIKAPYTLYGNPISTFISLPGFSVKKLTTLNNVDGGGVRIDFDYRALPPPPPGSPWPVALSGWWIVDPNHGWILRQYWVVELGDEDAWTGRVEYSIEDGEAKLSKVSLNDGTGKHTAYKFEFACKNLLFKSTPKKEFTLAAYGLGDAELPPGRTFNWSPYWFFGLAALAIVVSVILRRRAEQ